MRVLGRARGTARVRVLGRAVGTARARVLGRFLVRARAERARAAARAAASRARTSSVRAAKKKKKGVMKIANGYPSRKMIRTPLRRNEEQMGSPRVRGVEAYHSMKSEVNSIKKKRYMKRPTQFPEASTSVHSADRL